MRRGTRGRGYGGGGRPPAPHQPQNNIPRLLQPQQSNSGPMMSNHLQGLKDIDMELELLKRKREIIEQQQQMLSHSYKQRNDYEQPMFSEQRESRYDDYTRLYDNPREHQHGGRGGRGEGSRKRPHIPVWENEAPPKRFTGPSRGAKKSFGSRNSPASHSRQNYRRSPEPLMAAPKPWRRPPPPQKKREFNPSKVSKPSTAPPLKLASHQPAERKRLVTAAVASGARGDEALVLRADREPTHLMVGRLELTLGAIMKDVKTANPQHEQLFKHPHVQRAMKQCVRDRIRTAMIGKPVSTTDHIKAAYYDMFPLENDNEVLTRGLMAHGNKDFVAVNAANPEHYFKKNMRILMSLKMEEMISKLQEIYNCGPIAPKKPQGRYRSHKHRSTQSEQPKAVEESSKDGAQPNAVESPKEGTQGDSEPQTDETQAKDNDQPETEHEAQSSENEPKKDDIKTEDAAETKTVEGGKEDAAETKTVEGIKEEPNTNESTADNQPEADIVEPVPGKEPTFVVPKELINNEQYLALDRLMTYKMLHLLKRYTPEFLKNMELDAMYRKTKATIIGETAKRLGKKSHDKPVSSAEAPASDTQNASATQTQEKPRLPPLFYAKILGKPSLPKRKAMEVFFSQFTPKTIKKHRTIHNLLFVGFLEKEPYEKMLAADGTVIGRFTLDIKVSERNENKKNPINTLKSQVDNLNDSTDSVIGADIDEQITDLLSSIRKTEEMENFADDIVMAEPPEANQKDVKKENGDETSKTEEVVDCDADEAENNLGEDDVVEVKDVPQNDDVEIIDAENDDGGVEVKDAQNDDDDVVEVINAPQNNDVEIKDAGNDGVVEDKDQGNDNETKDLVGALKSDVKATPTRASARLATPGGIKTRRMSKLAE